MSLGLIEFIGGVDRLGLLSWEGASALDVLFPSSQKPLETVGDDTTGFVGALDRFGSRTSRRALAPQLIRLTKGLVGLPDAGSESSMALSSEMELIESRLNAKPDCIRGGDPLALGMLILR